MTDIITTKQEQLSEFSEKFAYKQVVSGDHHDMLNWLGEQLDLAEARGAEKVNDHLREALYALGLMYLQYCATSGHLFMSAGETAQEVLERHNLLNADAVGRGEPDWDKLNALSTSTN